MSLPVKSIREKVEQLQEAVRHLPQVVMPTEHYLLEGMYCRQIFIPAGTLWVGRVHKKFHFFIVAKGESAATTDDGITLLKAGMVLMSPPGTKRAGVTSSDCVFITLHRTEATKLEDIEDDLVEFDPKSRYGVGNQPLNLLEDL